MNGTDGTSEEEVKFRQQAEKERGPINRATECADTEECPGTGTMQEESVGPNKTGPNLNTLEGVTSEINRNADIAVELTRRAAERGRITGSAQAFGTRAHKIVEGLNDRLDRRLGDVGSPITVRSEQFRDAARDLTRTRASGSIGADVEIRNLNTDEIIRVLDLKTHGGKEIFISPTRQQDFINRTGFPAEEILRQR